MFAALFFWFDGRRLPYFEPAEGKGYISAAGLQVAEAVFHPYVGYVLRATREGNYISGTRWKANNRGFHNLISDKSDACCDYPYVPDKDEIVMGIFGGSVGSGFALSAQMSQIFDKLGRLPKWHGKKVRVLNFALPGFKQPQQLMTLAYFLNMGQQFDIIINIDGFNEAVTTFKNLDTGIEPIYPADSLWGAWGRHLDQADAVESRWSQLSNYHSLTAKLQKQKAKQARLTTLRLYHEAFAGWHVWRASQSSEKAPKALKRTGYFPTALKAPLPHGMNIWGYTVSVWSQASEAMALLAHQHGAVYVHLLQPNQWDAATGSYDPMNPDHPYEWVINPVNETYQLFRSAGLNLKQSGVNFVDITALFNEQQSREVYIDDCCHYTQLGNELIFEFTISHLSGLN
jgi:hypothetical protein